MKNPHKNVGRAIIISLLICAVIYVFVAIAVASNLSVPKIIEAKDYSLAEANVGIAVGLGTEVSAETADYDGFRCGLQP